MFNLFLMRTLMWKQETVRVNRRRFIVNILLMLLMWKAFLMETKFQKRERYQKNYKARKMDMEEIATEAILGAAPQQPSCLSTFIDEGSLESHRYFLSRRTAMEMLRDRGFIVPASEIDMSLQEFRSVYGQTPDIDRIRFSATHKSDVSKKVLVIFCGTGVIKVNMVRGIAAQIVNKETVSGIILIVQNRITNPAMKAMELVFPGKVEVFQITDLLVNITKHVLKPKHRILSKQEKLKLLKKYSIEEKQLPRMLKTDAIARYYGLEKGQVMKVMYDSGITESHVTYRCVW